MAQKQTVSYNRLPDHDLDFHEIPQHCHSFEELWPLILGVQAAGGMELLRIVSTDPARLKLPAVYRLARTERELAALEDLLRPALTRAKRFFVCLHDAPMARSANDQRAAQCLTVVWTAGRSNPADYFDIKPES